MKKVTVPKITRYSRNSSERAPSDAADKLMRTLLRGFAELGKDMRSAKAKAAWTRRKANQ